MLEHFKKGATTEITTCSFPLECVLKEFGDLVWYPTKVNVDFVERQRGYWYANISWTPLTGTRIDDDALVILILMTILYLSPFVPLGGP